MIPNILFVPQVLAAGEMCSSMPLNGGPYWWTGALAPPKWSRLFSFVTGWLSILASITSMASFAFAVSSSFYIAVSYIHQEWTPTNPQLMGISFAVVLVWLALVFLRLDRVGMIFMGCGT